MNRNVVGKRVKEARRKSKPPITQGDLAARLETLGMKADQVIISKIEIGTRPVYDYEVVIIAEALKVSACWLLGIKDK